MDPFKFSLSILIGKMSISNTVLEENMIEEKPSMKRGED